MTLGDKTLVCTSCGKEFIFTSGEQEFYASHGLQNDPKRCPECRAVRRRERQSDPDSGRPRQMYNVVCASCGMETTVPFEPRSGRPVYCKECFNKMRAANQVNH